jgi:hypothetical protein
MTPPPQRLDRTWRRAAPGVQVRAPEEQFAADAGLLGGDGAFSGESAQAVAADAEVFGCAAAVHPLIGTLVMGFGQPSRNAISDEFGELTKELVQNQPAGRRLGKRRIADDESELRRRPSLLGGVRLHCRDLPKGLGRASGCSSTAGAAYFSYSADYTSRRTELITGDVIVGMQV